MVGYDPREWFEIGGTGYDPVKERDRFYQDYQIEDPGGLERQLQERRLGYGRVGAEEQARAGGEQARRQAMSLAGSAPGVRTGQALRAGERAGDLAEGFAAQQAQQARVQDQYMSEQLMGQLLGAQSGAQQQRAALDQLYSRMGFEAAKSDFATEQVEDAGFLGFLGNILSSLVSGNS